MANSGELVNEAFSNAQTYASNATGQLNGYLSALQAAIPEAPLVDITFTPVSSVGSASPPIYMPAGAYSSVTGVLTAVLDRMSIGASVRTAITDRLVGGTGLDAAVEDALWDRARERELALASANIDQAMYDSEALGFMLPTGVLADMVSREQRGYYDKVSTLSREISIEQAKLEQSNIQKTIDQGVALDSAALNAGVSFEGTNIEGTYKTAMIAIEEFRAEVGRFQAEVEENVKNWEASIKQNEAALTYSMNGAKINSDIINSHNALVLEAGKVGAQVYAQLAASAYSIVHASAGISASGNMQVSYSYSNDTSSTVAPVTSV